MPPTDLPPDPSRRNQPVSKEIWDKRHQLERELKEFESAKALVMTTMFAWLDGHEPVWPYARILHDWGPDFEMYRRNWNKPLPDFARTIAMHQLRDLWIQEFGFSIPCAELLDELATSKFVVEVGAGTGFMTRLMKHRGIKVIGTDIEWRGPNHYRFETGRYDSEQIGGLQGKTAVRRFRDADTIFCSWPTYDHTWFRQMLKAMRIGQRLIVIREDATGDDTAWQYYDACFERIKDIDIPAFYHLNDYADVAIKKKQNGKHDKYEPRPSFKESMALLREATAKLKDAAVPK
jgi:SAM-dependent methyltransferase